MGVMRFLALFILLFSVLIFQAAEARIRRYNWEVKLSTGLLIASRRWLLPSMDKAPVQQSWPKKETPSLLSSQMIGTPWFDGTEGVTQCPILPGDTFTYDLGLIYTMPITECKEKLGCMDRFVCRLLVGRLSPLPMTTTGASSSLTGTIIPLMNKPWACPPFLLTGSGSLSSGENISPSGLELDVPVSSQFPNRVLVKADQDPSRNYWVTTSEVSRNNTVTPPGLAILNYYPNHPKKSPPTVPPAGPLWNDVEPLLNQSRAIKAHHDYIVPPPHTSTSPTSPT
ncbi:hypothetical protein CK203_001834 [Vitis vinifera]|uniref:Plastocyanin-like domain-containing protein n=1 Tax=Vitis vinifera TaxID=29760 RepID=A0A438KIS5_VITVI|nr:hypothetical protein CK203_001834 [Vitis vinifera]